MQLTVTVTVTVTLEVMAGLVCLFFVRRAFRTIQDSQSKLRQLTEECRKLNEQRSAVHTARWQRGECPRCASPLYERDWYLASTIVEKRLDGD